MNRIERVRPPGEMLPQRCRHHREPTQPPPDRRFRSAQVRSDPPIPLTAGGGRQRRTDNRDTITPTQQHVFRQQHMRYAAHPTDRAAQPAAHHPIAETHLTPDTMTPRPHNRPTRAHQQTTRQLHLDGSRVDPYDKHNEAPVSSERASSRSDQEFGEEALARSDHLTLPPPPARRQTRPQQPTPCTPPPAPPPRPPPHAHPQWRQTTPP